MRIQVCGRVAIERAGQRCEEQLPGRQGRLLFVYLVAHRRRPVTRSQLEDALWGDEPPAAVDPALNALLSKMRRVLGRDVIDGAALRLPPGTHVDLEAAEEAVHRAESAIALGQWGRAWGAAQVTLFAARRGFLPGEDAPWVRERRRALDDLGQRALEAYAEAALALGGTELATAERAGRELVALAPFRESGVRLLMRALVAEGNLAESLRIYDELRARLRDELGIAPAPETRALHSAVLAGAEEQPERA